MICGVVKRVRDPKWIKDRDEKGSYNNIVLDLFLHDQEVFRRFMRMNYEQFIELTEKIAHICFQNGHSDEKSDMPQTKTCINLKISCNWREFSFIGVPISDQ